MDEMTTYMEAMVFDLDKIFDFVFQDNTKSKSSEIRQLYDKNDSSGDLELIQKSMAEIKTDELSASANIRYDFIKLLIDNVSHISMDHNFSEFENMGVDTENLKDNDDVAGTLYFETLGEILALNTLKTRGMIKTIDTKNLTDGKE